jgi:pyruvate dehydrogenase E1 component alpha subunit
LQLYSIEPETLMATPTETLDSVMPATRELVLDLHRRMVRIRRFEERAGKLVESGDMPGFLHLYVGQEAVAAGVCSALTDSDQITSTHRGHGHAIAKGADFRPMFAELYGKTTGYCKGRGGSMHIVDMNRGMLGANAIVGGGIPIAVGAAFASQYRGDGTVAVSFFGDGATNIGAFHESVNMAAVLNLPVVFVIENNGYAEFTPQDRHMKLTDIAERASSYGIPGVIVDGMDVLAVRNVAMEAVERAKRGEGPTIIEAKTYRYFDHQGIKGMRILYRDPAEVEAWKSRDAINLIEAIGVERGLVSAEEFADIWAQTEADIDDGIEFARTSPDPDPVDILDDVYTT